MLMCCMFSVSLQAAPGNTVLLKAGTMIPMELMRTVSGQSVHAGQMIPFRVMNDVVVDGKTVIEAGAIAQGQVVRVEKAQLMGLPGELEIVVRSVTAIDGTSVPLAGDNLSAEGNNRVAAAIVVTILCLFGFCIKGGKAELPSGTVMQPMVVSNVKIATD